MAKFNLEDASTGIDEIMIRQPLGVTAAHWKRVQCQGGAKNYVVVVSQILNALRE
jgi:hypothetical protein